MTENRADTTDRLSYFRGHGRIEEPFPSEHENVPNDIRKLFAESGFSKSSNVEVTDEGWAFSFVAQDKGCVEIQDGDLFDFFLQPYFRTLLELKMYYCAEFELEIAINKSGPEFYSINGIVLAMLSSLNVDITIVNSLKSDASSSEVG